MSRQMTELPTRKVFVEGRIPRVKYPGEVRYSSMGVESYVTFQNIPYARRPEGVKRYQVRNCYSESYGFRASYSINTIRVFFFLDIIPGSGNIDFNRSD